MTKPPPDDLKAWSKNELIHELRRQRALNREHSEQVNPSHSGGGVTDVAGDPYAKGGALIDMRGAVLLDNMDVVLVDTKQDDPVAMVMRLGGRINYATERADTTYLFGPDGAAAIVTEIMEMAARAGGGDLPHGKRFAEEFREALERRTEEMP